MAPVLSPDPQDLQDSPGSLERLVAQVSKETEDFQEHLVQLDLLVHPVFWVLQDSLERRETQAMLSQWAVEGETRVTLASPGHLVFLVWMVDLVVMDSLEPLDPKELLALWK